jgi:amidase
MHCWTGWANDVDQKNMALEAASACTAMTPAESAAVFDILAPLAGRPITQTDVKPVTWAIIQRVTHQPLMTLPV